MASVAKDSAVVEAAATRATRAAIAPVAAVLVPDADDPADAASTASTDGAAVESSVITDGAVALAFNVCAEVAQRPEVEEDAATAEDVAEALEVDAAAGEASAVVAGAEVDQRPDVDPVVLVDVAVEAGVAAELVALGDGVPTDGAVGAAGERPEGAALAGADGENAAADELPGRVGRGGGFAAGGGDAAGAGRGGGTVGTAAALETGLLTFAGRGPAAELAGEAVAGRLDPGDPAIVLEGCCVADEAECDAGVCDCVAGEPECAVVEAVCDADEPECAARESDCAADECAVADEPERSVAGAACDADEPDCAARESNCAADELERVVDEAAAGDAPLPAGAGLAVVRALEVVAELAGRVDVPTGEDPCGVRAPGWPEAAADAAASLAAASESRDPESEMLLSEPAREGVAAVGAEGALEPAVFADVPPMAGMPNPAGEIGFPGTGAAGPAAGADEGVAEAAVDAGVAEGAVDAGAAEGVLGGGAAGADVDACDVAPEDDGANAPLPAESVSTGPSGSNN